MPVCNTIAVGIITSTLIVRHNQPVQSRQGERTRSLCGVSIRVVPLRHDETNHPPLRHAHPPTLSRTVPRLTSRPPAGTKRRPSCRLLLLCHSPRPRRVPGWSHPGTGPGFLLLHYRHSVYVHLPLPSVFVIIN